MGNSAVKAKERLARISYREWLGRVDEGLAAAGLATGSFPDSPFESWYRAGLTPGRVAQVIIGCQLAARAKKGSKAV